jgi:hypothetical protein
MNEETLARNVKKVNKWGKGLSVFVTKEAKLFGWDDETYIIISAMRDEEGDKIVIRKAIIK